MQYALQDIVNNIARRVPAPASLIDPELNSIVFGPHDSDTIDQARRYGLLTKATESWVRDWFYSYGIATAETPVRVEACPERAGLSRVVVPVRYHGHTYGYLSFLDPDHRLDPAVLPDIHEELTDLARLLYQHAEQQRTDAGLLSDLLRGTEPDRAAAAFTLTAAGSLGYGWQVTVVVVRAAGTIEQADRTLRPVLTRLSGGYPCLAESGSATVLISSPPHDQRRAARTAHEILPLAGSKSEIHVGIGDPVADLTAARLSQQQAWRAARAAAASPRFNGSAEWAELGHFRALTLLNPACLQSCVDPRINALLAADDGSMRTTLHAYFDLDGDAARAAEALCIHRGTLYYRLHKAESISGLKFTDGADRTAAQLSLDALRLLDADQEAPMAPAATAVQ